MDYFSLISRFAILVFLAIAHAHAGTTVIYPQYSAYQAGASSATFGTTFKIPATETMSNNWGTKSGWFWQSPNAGSLAATSRMSAADAQAINRAITGAAKASQSAARVLAGVIIKASIGGLLLTIVADQGLEYLNGQWMVQPIVGISPDLASSCPPFDWAYRLENGGTIDESNFCQTISGALGTSTCGTDRMCVGNGASPFVARLAVDADYVPTRDLTDAELAEMVRLGYAVPVEKPVATVVIANGNDLSALTSAELAFLMDKGYFTDSQVTVNNGPAYTDPLTGQLLQPKLSVEAAPNGAVRVSSSDLPVDAAGAPAKNVDGTDKAPVESNDPCAGNPDSVQCSTLGSLDPAGDPLPTTHNLAFQPGTLATAGACPAPRSFSAVGHPVVVSYQPICDAATTYVRPFVLLASAIATYFIFVGGLRT